MSPGLQPSLLEHGRTHEHRLEAHKCRGRSAAPDSIKQAAKIGSSGAQHMIRAILRTIEALEQNVNARVALEVLMLDVPTVR